MKRIDKKAIISTIAIVCITIVGFLILVTPGISTRTWVLFSAQQADAPYLVVAHGKDFAASNIEDPMYKFSKPIELICEANDGKLLLTDKTNGKTYEGTYKITSHGGGRFQGFNGETYTVVINGVEGTANISSRFNRTLFISVGGYCLNFEGE